MKKYILLLVLGIMAIIGTAFADETEKNDDSDFTAVNEQLYLDSLDENFSDYDSRVAYYSISQDVVENCSTEELLELILSCPLLCNIRVYNSREEGLESLINDFNYFDEFMHRDDAFETVLNAYLNVYVPTSTVLDYDLLVRDNTKIADMNMLARNKSLSVYVLRDARVENSVDALETIMLYLSKKYSPSAEEIAQLSTAIDNLYEMECSSEYYEYGERLSDFANSKQWALFKVENGQNPYMVSSNAYNNRSVTYNYVVFTHNGAPAQSYGNKYNTAQTANSVQTTIQLATTYSASVFDPSVREFNCHSYVFLPSISAYSSSYKHIWLNVVNPFLTDGYYTEDTSNNQFVGEIANSGLYHSALVYLTNQYNPSTQVPEHKYKSKWGEAGIFVHFKANCPYPSATYKYYVH